MLCCCTACILGFSVMPCVSGTVHMNVKFTVSCVLLLHSEHFEYAKEFVLSFLAAGECSACCCQVVGLWYFTLYFQANVTFNHNFGVCYVSELVAITSFSIFKSVYWSVYALDDLWNLVRFPIEGKRNLSVLTVSLAHHCSVRCVLGPPSPGRKAGGAWNWLHIIYHGG